MHLVCIFALGAEGPSAYEAFFESQAWQKHAVFGLVQGVLWRMAEEERKKRAGHACLWKHLRPPVPLRVMHAVVVEVSMVFSPG